jgi:1-acyl-sn-glycerol-3-phosphate acyltransferase
VPNLASILPPLLLAWLAWAAFAHLLLRRSPRVGDPVSGLALLLARLYVRVVHRLRVQGGEHVPRSRDAGPLLVVANHASGVDPILVQSACPFFVRWLMAEDMRAEGLDSVWRWAEVIFVDRREGRSVGLRDAIQHVRSGGVVGIFPEGRIADEPGRLLPFEPGVGLLIARSGADVLPVLIEGAPRIESAWAALWTPSRSRIRFLPVVSFKDRGASAREAAHRLEGLFLDASGWSAGDPTGSTTSE